MIKNFENRVVREGIVDTKKYRYCCKDYAGKREIQRLPLTALDTTAAIDGWEIVKVIK